MKNMLRIFELAKRSNFSFDLQPLAARQIFVSELENDLTVAMAMAVRRFKAHPSKIYLAQNG